MRQETKKSLSWVQSVKPRSNKPYHSSPEQPTPVLGRAAAQLEPRLGQVAGCTPLVGLAEALEQTTERSHSVRRWVRMSGGNRILAVAAASRDTVDCNIPVVHKCWAGMEQHGWRAREFERAVFETRVETGMRGGDHGHLEQNGFAFAEEPGGGRLVDDKEAGRSSPGQAIQCSQPRQSSGGEVDA